MIQQPIFRSDEQQQSSRYNSPISTNVPTSAFVKYAHSDIKKAATSSASPNITKSDVGVSAAANDLRINPPTPSVKRTAFVGSDNIIYGEEYRGVSNAVPESTIYGNQAKEELEFQKKQAQPTFMQGTPRVKTEYKWIKDESPERITGIEFDSGERKMFDSPKSSSEFAEWSYKNNLLVSEREKNLLEKEKVDVFKDATDFNNRMFLKSNFGTESSVDAMQGIIDSKTASKSKEELFSQRASSNELSSIISRNTNKRINLFDIKNFGWSAASYLSNPKKVASSFFSGVAFGITPLITTGAFAVKGLISETIEKSKYPEYYQGKNDNFLSRGVSNFGNLKTQFVQNPFGVGGNLFAQTITGIAGGFAGSSLKNTLKDALKEKVVVYPTKESSIRLIRKTTGESSEFIPEISGRVYRKKYVIAPKVESISYESDMQTITKNALYVGREKNVLNTAKTIQNPNLIKGGFGFKESDFSFGAKGTLRDVESKFIETSFGNNPIRASTSLFGKWKIDKAYFGKPNSLSNTQSYSLLDITKINDVERTAGFVSWDSFAKYKFGNFKSSVNQFISNKRGGGMLESPKQSSFFDSATESTAKPFFIENQIKSSGTQLFINPNLILGNIRNWDSKKREVDSDLGLKSFLSIKPISDTATLNYKKLGFKTPTDSKNTFKINPIAFQFKSSDKLRTDAVPKVKIDVATTSKVDAVQIQNHNFGEIELPKVSNKTKNYLRFGLNEFRMNTSHLRKVKGKKEKGIIRINPFLTPFRALKVFGGI